MKITKKGPPLERPNLFFVQQLWVFKISSFKKEKVGWGENFFRAFHRARNLCFIRGWALFSKPA